MRHAASKKCPGLIAAHTPAKECAASGFLGASTRGRAPRVGARLLMLAALLVFGARTASAALSVAPSTWNVIGLDSNNVNSGPDTFLVGTLVCNTGGTTVNNITGTFVWDSSNSFINLTGLSTVTTDPLAPGQCTELFFNVTVTRSTSAYNQTRSFHINVTATGEPTYSTPTPREIYVEKLVSQNRNSTQSISGPTSVVVGQTYTYTVNASTATGGYEQLESFLNFPNSMFEVLSISTTYTAPTGATNNKIYADACGWDNNPSSASYRSCIGPANYSGGKAGGTIATTYTVRVIGSGGTATMNSLVYDFSGSSYHYGNDYGSQSITVTAQTPPDMTLTKSHAGNFTQGQSGSYTITATNSGQLPTSGTVTVTDTLPTGLTPTAAAGTGWTCSISGQTVTCTRSNVLAAGSSYPAITLSVSVAPNSPLSVTNTASVSGGGETNTGNDTASDPTTVNGVPDVTIAKRHSGNFTQGQTGTYTLTASNAGGAATSGTVTVSDTVPAGLTPTSATGTGWACSISGQTITCTRSDALAAGASYPAISLAVSVAPNSALSVTNSAAVSGGGQTNTANDSASDPTTINGVPDLTIAKSHSGNFTQGQSGTYTITASNSGGAATSGTVTVTDTLPAGLTYSSATGTGWSCSASGQTVTCTRSDALAAGSSYPAITVSVNAATNAPSSVTNTASVSGGGQTNTGNDTASDPTNINGVPNLTIAKTHAGNFTRGQTGTYTVTVSNAGGAATSGLVTVTDTVPAGLTSPTGSGTGWTCSTSGQTVTCTRSNALAAGGSYPAITVTASVAQSAASSVTNTASASGGGETFNGDDTASDPTTVVSSADLSLTKTVNNPNPIQGQNVTFTVTLANAGPSDATGVAVTDALPAGLTFVSATPSVGAYNSGTGVWSVASLASGASATLQIVAHVDNAGTITNTAEVTASNQPDPDSTPNNHNAAEDDQASASIGAAAPPAVGLVKSVSPGGTQRPGTDLTYTVVFTNNGGAAATNFVLTDPDPATTLKINDNTDFKVGSVVNNLGTTGLSVTVSYSNDGGVTFTYTPASGAGGAPAGYDGNVTHIRWSFTGNLSQTPPNNTGSVSFTTRIR